MTATPATETDFIPGHCQAGLQAKGWQVNTKRLQLILLRLVLGVYLVVSCLCGHTVFL